MPSTDINALSVLCGPFGSENCSAANWLEVRRIRLHFPADNYIWWTISTSARRIRLHSKSILFWAKADNRTWWTKGSLIAINRLPTLRITTQMVQMSLAVDHRPVHVINAQYHVQLRQLIIQKHRNSSYPWPSMGWSHSETWFFRGNLKIRCPKGHEKVNFEIKPNQYRQSTRLF